MFFSDGVIFFFVFNVWIIKNKLVIMLLFLIILKMKVEIGLFLICEVI